MPNWIQIVCTRTRNIAFAKDIFKHEKKSTRECYFFSRVTQQKVNSWDLHDLHIFLVVAFEFVERYYVFTYNVVNRLHFEQKIAYYLKSAQNRKKNSS